MGKNSPSAQSEPSIANQANPIKARSLLVAAGASILLLSPSFAQLISPGHLILFHQNLDLANVFGGIALDFIAAFLACTGLLWLLSRIPLRIREVSEACIAGFLIWLVLRAAVSFTGTLNAEEGNGSVHFLQTPAITSFSAFFRHHNLVIGLLTLLSFGLMAWVKRGSMRFVIKAVQLCLASLAFCGLWIVPEFVGLALHFHKSQNFDHSSAQGIPLAQKRIVWILFDELSYKLAIEKPPDGMRFPTFEQLRSQSISLDTIQPVELLTDRIVTSVMIGRKINRIKSTLDGRLLYWDPTSTRWLSYDPESTLFGLANRNGWNPAIAGWYNPYCRIFPQILTACSWSPYSGNLLFQESKSDDSIVSGALTIPRKYVNRLLVPSAGDAEVRVNRIADYQKLMATTSRWIRDGQVRFVFIHLPVPHPPGMYDRKSHQLGTHGNYLDNLVLADDTLRQIQQEIAQSPAAADTTLIVSSDHSWRLPMWRSGVGWTAEEDRVSGGIFDTRPVFLVHFPTQTTGTEIFANEPELVEHDIVAAMLEGKINSPESLQQFLASR